MKFINIICIFLHIIYIYIYIDRYIDKDRCPWNSQPAMRLPAMASPGRGDGPNGLQACLGGLVEFSTLKNP